MNKEIILNDEQKQVIENELSKDNNVELIPTSTGVIIKRIKRENIKINTEPVHK